MNEVQDHLVHFPEGFYDMNRYPERIEQGGKRLVTKLQYRQMRNSDGSVELIRIEPPVDVLQRLVGKARKEKAAQVADPLEELLVEPVADEPDWQPAPHYKGMLNKDGGMDD